MSHCRYIHDDSETVEDTVGLTVTDGVNSAHVFLPVQVSRLYTLPFKRLGSLRNVLVFE